MLLFVLAVLHWRISSEQELISGDENGLKSGEEGREKSLMALKFQATKPSSGFGSIDV